MTDRRNTELNFMETAFMDAEISARHIEVYTKEIEQWVETHKDTLFARKVFPTRTASDGEIDIVTNYERIGSGAVIAAKGHIPKGSGSKATDVPHTIYQIIDGFGIHRKDAELDPKKRARDVRICLDNIHRREDLFTINGDATLNVLGLVGTAQANPNGKGVAAGASGNDFNNHGDWATDAAADPHADIVEMIARMSEGQPKWLVGHRNDLLYLFKLDSQRQPFWKTIAPMFGVQDTSFMFATNLFTRGKVYTLPKDERIAEFVIGENPRPIILPMGRGQIYPVELVSWVVPEFHRNDSIVELDIT